MSEDKRLPPLNLRPGLSQDGKNAAQASSQQSEKAACHDNEVTARKKRPENVPAGLHTDGKDAAAGRLPPPVLPGMAGKAGAPKGNGIAPASKGNMLAAGTPKGQTMGIPKINACTATVLSEASQAKPAELSSVDDDLLETQHGRDGAAPSTVEKGTMSGMSKADSNPPQVGKGAAPWADSVYGKVTIGKVKPASVPTAPENPEKAAGREQSAGSGVPLEGGAQGTPNMQTGIRPSGIPGQAAGGGPAGAELPEAWLDGADVEPDRRTSFSLPQTLPVMPEKSCIPEDPSLNVGLEKNESIPDALEDVIIGYDDEIRNMRTRDGVRECTIQLAIARVLEHTGYEKLAYVRYLKALEANRSSRMAIHELRRIARAYNKTKDVVTLLQSGLDTAVSGEEQSILLEEAALILFFQENPRRDEAVSMLYRAIALAPSRVSPHLTLLLLLLFENRLQESCDILSKLVFLSEDSQAQSLCQIMLGDIRSSLTPGQAAGLDNYLQVLEIQPDSLYAYQHAMGILLRQHSWQSFYKRTLEFSKHSKDKALLHAATVVAGAVAYGFLSDPQGACRAYENAFSIVPGDTLPLELLLDNYADDAAQWQAFDETLVRILNECRTPRERAEYILMRAVNLDLYGNQPERAVEVLREICSDGRGDAVVIAYYGGLLRRCNAVDELVAFEKRAAQNEGCMGAVRKFAQIGCYCLDEVQKLDEAEACFRCALSVEPDNRIAFDNLEVILRARKEYEEIMRMYLLRLDVTTEATTRASLLHTLATLCDYNLCQYDNAILYYRQYREIYPDDVCAIHNLERLYAQTGDWSKLIELYLIEKMRANTAAQRSDILMRVANICRYKLKRPLYSLSFLKQAKKETPNALAVYREMLEVLELMQDWKTYISVSRELLNIERKDDERIATLFDIGMVYERYLFDNSAAIACYESVLKLDADNHMAYVRLSNIYRKTANYAAYYELVLGKAHRMPPSIAKKHRVFKIALESFAQFHDMEQCIGILEQSVDSGGDYLPEVYLLSMLYAATARIDPLIGVIQEFTNNVKDQSTKGACASTLAYLKMWLKHAPQEAIHPLELSLALMPDASSVGFMLILAQYWRGAYTELASLCTERAQNSSDHNYAVFFYNMAAFFAHRFPNQPNTYGNEVAALKAAIEIEPENIIANERLEAIEASYVNLMPFFEKRLKFAPPEEKAELQLAIAESTFSEKPQQAFAMVCQVVEEHPTHLPAIRIASNIAIRLNNYGMSCQFLAMEAQNMDNIAMRIIAWTNAAKIARDKLNQLDLAIEYFKQAFLLAPQQMELCDQLLELLKRKHDFAAIDMILQIHTRSISRENQIMRYIQMADSYIQEFNEPQQAIVKLRQILEIEHDNVDVLWKLAKLELEQPHYHEARALLERLLEIPDIDESVAAEARSTLARLYIDHFNELELAMPLLQKNLSASPEDADTLRRMADVYFQLSRFNEALGILFRLETMIPAPGNVPTLLQIATIYKAQMEQDKVGQILQKAAHIAQQSPAVLDSIQKWLERCKDPATILAFVETLTSIGNDEPRETRVRIYAFAARVYGGPLHMRFEADKYAVMAANLAPDSYEMQLLASRVFSPKEAMAHATVAARLSPFNPEPYQAMLSIARDAERIDLQARVEQQLEVLAPSFSPTPELQQTYTSRYPKKPGIISPDIIRQIAAPDFHFNIQKLMALAEGHAQIFSLPPMQTMPLSASPAIQTCVQEIAPAFGIDPGCILLSQEGAFIFAASHNENKKLILNVSILQNVSAAERRFHVACALLHTRLGTLPFVSLPPENIAMLVSGLIGLCDEKLTTPDVLAILKSVMPRNIRKRIVEFISQNGVGAFQYDPAKLQADALQLDFFTGHLFSVDLKSSVAGILRRFKPNIQIPENPHQWFVSHIQMPQIQALFEFNISERYSELRQKLGTFIRMSEK